MSFFLILAILIGGGVGWFAAQNRIIAAEPVMAAALGALGGFLGGLALKLILPIAFMLIGAAVGAAILLVLYKLIADSRR